MLDAQDRFSEFSSAPLYNTKAVVRETGVPADTIRAWERRYGMPRPSRTQGGHRLYSARDLALIRWLRDRTNEGLTISQAVQMARSQTAQAESPQPAEHSWGDMRKQLYHALVAYNSAAADTVLSRAFGTYPVEAVCLQLIEPVLVEIGRAWAADEIGVSQEHFASQHLRNRLAGLLTSALTEGSRGRVVIACAEGEQHDIGALQLALFLARRGWNPIFLGANVPGAELITTVRTVRPRLVGISASSPATAEAARPTLHELATLADPPLLVYGGQGFHSGTRLNLPPGHYAGPTTEEAIEQITALLAEHPPA